MKYYLTFILTFFVNLCFSQLPSFTRDLSSGSKYILISEQTNSEDFKSVSQLKIGTYLTLGNYGYHNHSWIGNNAVLSYSAYGGTGSQGISNKFIPAWPDGKALIIDLEFHTAEMKGYTYDWNGSSLEVDIDNFTTSWMLGPASSYFSGKVGIGTTTPDAKLTVKGDIHAQEVKVDMAGAVVPDYVFAPDYPLMTLDQVSEYIQQHSHLPDIPSASEMEENGMKLKEMNLLLLKKVEELTLYVIQLEERDRQQEKDKEMLKQKLIEYDQKLEELYKLIKK